MLKEMDASLTGEYSIVELLQLRFMLTLTILNVKIWRIPLDLIYPKSMEDRIPLLVRKSR